MKNNFQERKMLFRKDRFSILWSGMFLQMFQDFFSSKCSEFFFSSVLKEEKQINKELRKIIIDK